MAMRVNHGFLFMMGAALLASFVVPAEKLQGKFDRLYTPIAYPVRRLAHGVWERTSEPEKMPSARDDKRGADKLRDEIETLKFQLVQKDLAIAELQRQLNDFNSIGKTLSQLCRSVKVTGGDAGSQQVLILNVNLIDSFVTGMPVIYPHGLVGRIEVVGVGAARVRLVTDKGFPQMRGQFVRYMQDAGEFKHLPLPMKAVAGRGDGRMEIQQYKASELTSVDKKFKLAVGDWIVLNDKDWPAPVQGIKLGEIEAITDQKNPLFVTITIRPDADLMKLQEVMVMVKK
jgi:cell shape-determining protein MreC